jgi:hypothetical protein
VIGSRKKVASTSKAIATPVKIHASRTPTRPFGMARSAVRGFLASILASIIRLRVMAAVRAPTIATVIQNRFETLKGTGAASIPA